jgi:hypothetical protein
MLQSGLPEDDTAMSFNSIAAKAKPLKDPEKELRFMREALNSAKANNTLIVRPTAQGIEILDKDDLTEEAIEKLIAPPAPPTAAAAPANVAKPNPFTAENMDAVDASTRETADQRYKALSARASSAKARQAESGKRASVEFQIAQLTKDQAAIVPLPGADGRLDYESAKKQWSRLDSELKKLRAQLGKL